MEAMDLFERYLQAVRKYLPWQRQDDIVAELRANLEAQREEREAGLGRPLTEGEMIDWLKELGSPLQMAGRYQPPRYVIGPAIFPLYWKILRLVSLWMTVAYAIGVVARMLVESHGPEWVAGQIAQYPETLIMAAAWITAVFAGLEFFAERHPEKCPDFMGLASHWSPTSLPPVEKEQPADGKPRTLTAAVAEFIVQFALLVWMLLIPSHPVVLMGPGAAFLEHSPVRLTHISIVFFWAIVAFGVLQLAWQGLDLLNGTWRIRSTVQRIVTKGLSIVPLAILLGAPGHRYIELNPAEAGRLPTGFNFDQVNHALFSGLTVVALIVSIQFVWGVWKALPSSRAARLRMVL
jgi:hypothetical protein